jgi:hypothetical protein
MPIGISEAVDLVKKVGDLVKAGATIGLQETIMELREAVLNAKDEVLRLREENQSLKEAVSSKSAWAETVAQYPLVEAPGGAMVRKTVGPPEHYACPKCFEDHKVYPLQSKRIVTTGEYGCPGCGRGFLVDAPGKLPEIRYPRGGGWSSR